MAISEQSIIDRAMFIANGAGIDAHSSPVIDNKYVIETMFPLALRQAVIEHARTPHEANGLKRTFSLTLVAGEAVLPDDVLDECLTSSSISSATDLDVAELTSYEQRYFDYIRPGYAQLGFYTNRGGTFCYRGIGENAGESVATVKLTAISMPVIPATSTTSMTISTSLADTTVEILARMMSGGGQ